MEDNIMFRYLEKYVGTYRVLSETDYESKDLYPFCDLKIVIK